MTQEPEDQGNQSHWQSAYERLIDEIRLGNFLPGARLRETDLAARLGISRTPVREAIRRLEADGLVEHQPRQGATLRRLGHAEVTELYEMRVVLESTAARLAARAASDLELAELDEINDEMTAATDPVLIARANRQFHATLLNAAKNRFLRRAMTGLRRTALVLGRSTLLDPDRIAAAAAEHATLLAALHRRDEPAAEAAMRAHIEAAHRSRLRQLRETGLTDDVEGWGIEND
ncbi:GntR family transcriptional regulator [Maritimibacter sp. HL-12]|uniref:GntR family transcriptional regulator n=1 Tax=Maritimibacter sp. HL-12 TaxID=1162418 RepID=UPI000A0F3713|nr:GntR family transcriptional regulator [Maritimibacter sp. HL-12]SMH28974.1 transcriptional regulator, GntR family [Maritimibacter sp. HL-12]